MSLTLQHGRPENMTERLKKEQKVYELLDLLHIEYDRVDHEPAMHMDVCEEIDKVLKAATCKNLFLCNRQKTDFYLLLIPGEKIFKTKDLSAQIGSSRLSFGTADYMEEFLDVTPGSVSILGLMNDTDHRVRLLVDSDVMFPVSIYLKNCCLSYRLTRLFSCAKILSKAYFLYTIQKGFLLWIELLIMSKLIWKTF